MKEVTLTSLPEGTVVTIEQLWGKSSTRIAELTILHPDTTDTVLKGQGFQDGEFVAVSLRWVRGRTDPERIRLAIVSNQIAIAQDWSFSCVIPGQKIETPPPSSFGNNPVNEIIVRDVAPQPKLWPHDVDPGKIIKLELEDGQLLIAVCEHQKGLMTSDAPGLIMPVEPTNLPKSIGPGDSVTLEHGRSRRVLSYTILP